MFYLLGFACPFLAVGGTITAAGFFLSRNHEPEERARYRRTTLIVAGLAVGGLLALMLAGMFLGG